MQHTSGLGAPAHIISVNTEPHCPMMAMSDLADRQRRQRDARPSAGTPAERTGTQSRRSRAGRHRRERRRRRRGGRSGARRVVRRHRARPRRPLGRAARARGVPRGEEHVRRRGVPADPRPAPPRVVGRGTDPTVDHPALDHDPHRRPGAHRRLPRRVVGPTAVQRCHRLPTRLGPLAGRRRPKPTVRTSSARPPPPDCCATSVASSVGVTTDRPDGDITARVVISATG